VSLPSWAGLVAAAVTLVTDGILVALLAAEDEGNQFGFAYVIGAVGLAALAASFVSRPDVRAPLLGGVAFVLLPLGMLAIFSVGLPLLVAAGFAAAGCGKAMRAAKGRWLGPSGAQPSSSGEEGAPTT